MRLSDREWKVLEVLWQGEGLALGPVVEALTHDLGRGVTLLHGQGAWSGQEKQVLMCAFKQRQIVAVRQTVKELDPDAFLIVCDAREVLGEGFNEYSPDGL